MRCAAIAEVWGSDQVPEGPKWTPHLSIAYASTAGSGDAYEAALGDDTVTVIRVTVAQHRDARSAAGN